MFDLFLAMTGGSIGVINYYYINDYARQDQWEDFSLVCLFVFLFIFVFWFWAAAISYFPYLVTLHVNHECELSGISSTFYISLESLRIPRILKFKFRSLTLSSSVPVPKYQIALPQPHLLSIGRGLKPSVRVIFIYLFIYLFRNLFLSSLRAQARYRTAGHTRAFWENLV